MSFALLVRPCVPPGKIYGFPVTPPLCDTCPTPDVCSTPTIHRKEKTK